VIYIVEDDEAVRDSLSVLFEVEGLETMAFSSAQGFLDELPVAPEGCVVTDVHMAGLNGLQLLRILKSSGRNLPVIVITGRSDKSLVAQALAAGATAVIEKPFRADEIVAVVRAALG